MNHYKINLLRLALLQIRIAKKGTNKDVDPKNYNQHSNAQKGYLDSTISLDNLRTGLVSDKQNKARVGLRAWWRN